jgi:hypothetical protein
MASYFDEHDCEPLNENEVPNNDLMLARLLIDSGIASVLNLNFPDLFGANGGRSSLAPAVSKLWLQKLIETNSFSESALVHSQCPICLKEYGKTDGEDQVKNLLRLPCGHCYHIDCVRLWLEQTSTCPSCRFEFPTDNKEYEEYKRQKKREKAREKDLENLHDSMYT